MRQHPEKIVLRYLLIPVILFLLLYTDSSNLFCAESRLYLSRFSDMEPGDHFSGEWVPLFFKKIKSHTRYELVQEETGEVVVKAVSHASASGLTKKITIDPSSYPVLSWRWKILNHIKGADPRTREGNDFPARLYVTFRADLSNATFLEKLKDKTTTLFYGQPPPFAAITYVWAFDLPVNTFYSSPYTDRAKICVLQRGDAHVGEWMKEERNIVEDFKTAFGEIPPTISAVAIMTDTDNTKGSATAFYGDIFFKKR